MSTQKNHVKLIFIFCLFTSQICAAGGDDLQYFSSYELKHKINDSFDIFIQPDLRFNDDIGNLYYWHVRSGIVYHLHKNLDLGATYRIKQTKTAKGSWIPEHRLEMEINPKIAVGNFKIVNRNRFEYRKLHASEVRWRYRNMIKIAYPLEIKGKKIIPFISQEIFYDMEVEKYNVNWVTVGVSKKLTKNVSGTFFYRVESKRVKLSSHWDTNHILGTKLSYKF